LSELPESRGAGKPATRGATIATELTELIRALWHRRWLIGATTLIALLAALFFLSVTTPQFLSSAQILIDPRAKRIVEGAVVPSGMGSSAVGADTLLVDSQVELMYSNAILRRVVVDLGLDRDEEFRLPRAAGLRMALRNSFGRWLTGSAPERLADADPVDLAVFRLKDRHLRIRRLGNTYVITVSAVSENAAKAARIANAVAEAYIRDQVVSASDTTRSTTGALEARVAELRKGLETAERAIEDYRTGSGLIGVPGLLVNEQQLQQQNEKLILARSQAALAKVRYDQVRSLTPLSIGLAAQSDALRSPVIANLRASLSRIERREAVLKETLRPGHPDYVSTRTERQAVVALIAEELERIKENARAEHETARAAEALAASELKQLEGRASSNNQAQVRLRELMREAQSARTVYESFLTRAKETREQEQLSRENSRIISFATPAPFPSYPPTMLVLAGALGGGGLLGAFLAWLGHHFSGTPAVAFAAGRIARRTAPVGEPRPEANAEEAAVAVVRRPRPSAPARAVARPPDPSAERDSPVQPAAHASSPASTLRAAASVPSRRTLPLTRFGRLPALQPRPRLATSSGRRWPGAEPGGVSFADVIGALEEVQAGRNASFRSSLDEIIAGLGEGRRSGCPEIVLFGALAAGAGTSSTALALAYRAQMHGGRTLLVDASLADAGLSLVFAADFAHGEALKAETRDRLAALVVRDSRVGLSFLPLALTGPARRDERALASLQSSVRALAAGYDLVVVDAGVLTEPLAAALAQVATRLLVVNRSGEATPDELGAAAAALGLPPARVGLVETMAA
jgi:uncharacterized protein involved in exopolysaccharide biosynthesis/Mrp family chromosome partitioning ATPase